MINGFIGIDHIAFATKSTEKSLEFFLALGFEIVVERKTIERFGVLITKLKSKDGLVIELVEPFRTTSVVSSILTNVDACIYHVSFKVDNVSNVSRMLNALGALTITKPMSIPYPATSSHFSDVTSHMFHGGVGLFELTGDLE